MIHIEKEKNKCILIGSLPCLLNDLSNAASGIYHGCDDVLPRSMVAALIKAAVSTGLEITPDKLESVSFQTKVE